MSFDKMFSVKNVGDRERILRIVLGFFFLYMSFNTGIMALNIIGILALFIGLVLVVTGVLASCPIYTKLGKSSCQVK